MEKRKQDETPEKPNERQTPLPPKLEEIVAAHLAEHPTLTRDEVLEEIRSAGF